MKRAFLKTIFVLTVWLFGLILSVPATSLLDAFPGDRLIPGVIAMGVCFFAADRVTSVLFRLAGLTDERWSVFNRRGIC